MNEILATELGGDQLDSGCWVHEIAIRRSDWDVLAEAGTRLGSHIHLNVTPHAPRGPAYEVTGRLVTMRPGAADQVLARIVVPSRLMNVSVSICRVTAFPRDAA